MTIEEKIYALWSGDATAIAIVPANRFKPAGGDYQNLAVPYVVHRMIGESPYRTHTEGAVGALTTGIRQFDIVVPAATSASSYRTILNKLISVFDGNKGGFNFHYSNSRFTAELPEGVAVYSADFLETA